MTGTVCPGVSRVPSLKSSESTTAVNWHSVSDTHVARNAVPSTAAVALAPVTPYSPVSATAATRCHVLPTFSLPCV